ncbi:subtilisin [Cordyceps javanica]|uniref:Subtilisin n=1 Tax=Cordyceps javanica TaxID=43265 RepID=A0A545UTI2_9HYPO|nr:subtilisin [Cordyceps javanica]TQW02092.1 subtilisin [Cordyceps javanica]
MTELLEALQRRDSRGYKARDTVDKAPWTHIMTQVDKLHKEGYTGKGIKIGIVDTGVNYSIPALGGCFGPNCRVAFGGTFDGFTMTPDPMSEINHGTIVASILAGNSKEDGFVGAAPDATLGAYMILDKDNIATYGEDNIMAAWLQAEKDGMQIIVSSFGQQGGNWAQMPTALLISRLVAKGIPCISGLGNQRSRGLFEVSSTASGRGAIAVNSFTDYRGIAVKSAAGPTPELDIKPQVGAPGERVPVINNDGSYGSDSGTSFAAPLVAGIMALVAEARGTFDPAVLESLLMSTAAPQGAPFSVALQGAGLVQAWNAAHASTIVRPTSLAFNDTDHRVPTLSLSITNGAKSDVQYQLSNVAAELVHTLNEKGVKFSSSNPPVPPTANSDQIKLSHSNFTLGPGQTISVEISASDPEGVDVDRLPVWSGYIKIQESGSANKSLTVPYLGVAGSLRSMTVMEKGARSVAVRDMRRPKKFSYKDVESTVVQDPPSMKSQPGRIQSFEWPANVQHGNPVARFNLFIGTPRLEVYVVPLDICQEESSKSSSLDLGRACVPETSLSEVGGIKSLGVIPGYSHDHRSRGLNENAFEFTGLLESGQFAPPGRYKFVARALAILGDADNDAHWQVEETMSFVFGYEANLMDPR